MRPQKIEEGELVKRVVIKAILNELASVSRLQKASLYHGFTGVK